MKELEEIEFLRVRRGVGLIYLLAGILHAGIMAFATLYSMGRIPFVITASLWSELYYAHFLFLAMSGGLYLFLSFKKSGLFHFEIMLDYAIGMSAFMLLLTFTGLALFKGWLPGWFSLTPSGFLLLYGRGLRAGKRFGFFKPPAP